MKPIIFIPGIEATNLVDANSFGFTVAWNAYDTLGSSLKTTLLGPHFDQPLQYEPLYDVAPSVIIERDSMAKLPYEKTFVNLNNKLNAGKQVPDPIYLFGYDWRFSNVESGRRLGLFVEYLKKKLSGNVIEGFCFVTHSMGALVLSCYLAQLKDYSAIDKVIFCAPPFVGSPYSLVHMVKGNGGFKSFLNKVLGNNDDMRKMARTFPSVFELLPSYANALTYTDDGAPLDLTRIAYWQDTIYDDIPELFAYRLKALADLRWKNMQDLSLLPPEVRRRIVVLAGTNDQTPVFVKVDRENDDVKNFIRLDLIKKGMGKGDGTVPIVSSSYFKNAVKTISIDKDKLLDELGDNVDFHGFFMRDSRVQNILVRYLGGKEYAANVDKGKLVVNDAVDNIWYSLGDSIHDLSPF